MRAANDRIFPRRGVNLSSKFSRQERPLKNNAQRIYLILKTDESFAVYSERFRLAARAISFMRRAGGVRLTRTKTISRNVAAKPSFRLPQLQSKAAQAELKQIKQIGDAPKYLGEMVLNWAKTAPRDRRIPESLYISFMKRTNGTNTAAAQTMNYAHRNRRIH